MNTGRAKEILQSLADGIDPYTGEPFPPDSPYQQADTVRALHHALQSLQHPAASDSALPTAGVPRRSDLAKAGGKWTEEEEYQLRDEFDAKHSIADIAEVHGRTKGAIRSRLIKLGLLDDTPANNSGQDRTPISATNKVEDPDPVGKQGTNSDIPAQAGNKERPLTADPDLPS